MRTIRYMVLLIILAPLGVAADVPANAERQSGAEKIAIAMKIQSDEVRTYDLSVHLRGKSSKSERIEATFKMKMQHKFGRREGDLLLPLEVVTSEAQATIGDQQFAMPSGEFPRLTFLIDNDWKVDSAYGIARTRYADRYPGLNYANLIMLFLIPDIEKPHAVGQDRPTTIKLPGFSDECKVATTYKSIETVKGSKVLNVHQEYTWTGQKLEDGIVVDSKAEVDSVLTIETGKLLSAKATSRVTFRKTDAAKKDDLPEQADTVITLKLVE
ncbi:MAG: hypothetical protein GX141_06120 [Armatimonadetes bacterium]|nr:hypothetical protein [Armatimonadota bacterium]